MKTMRPVRNRPRGGVGNGKTPIKIYPNLPNNCDEDQQRIQDPVEVFCRIRPCPDPQEVSCISLQSASKLTITPPDINKNRKIFNCTFNHIFTEHADQKQIFEKVSMPLLEGFIQGENGLLFSYGVTGSGKTYTMCGEPNNPGIVPRCINVLFNSIGSSQTPKFLVKSDKLNGFELQGEGDALEERLSEAKIKRRTAKKGSGDLNTLFLNDGMRLQVNESLFYTVFVTYVEIYNNLAYDLLDENSGNKSLQTKILREDCTHNIYVNGVVEIEVKSAEEALELYLLGGKRKRMAQTSLNTESSRSHSIFTIRLVIGKSDGTNSPRDRSALIVSQLSLVDLAGSERCSRTHTTGQRLKEAGNINNSLMALRTCLEILRENQQTGSNRLVPYRESRLTHLFKNYFEGEGKVKMIVCINPSLKDFEETVHVMKFAEMTQEVRVLRPDVKIPEPEEDILKAPLLKDIEIIRRRSRHQVPRVRLIDPESDEIKSLILYLKRRRQTVTNLKTIRKMSDKFRLRLVDLQTERDNYEKQVKYLLPSERQKVADLQNKLINVGYRHDEMQRKCFEKDQIIQDLNTQIEEKDFQLKQNVLEKAHQKRKIEQVSEKMTHELDAKLRRQREFLHAQMKEKTEKLELVKDILTNNVPTDTIIKSTAPPESVISQDVQFSTPRSVATNERQPCSEHLSRREVPVANVRYRRSRSAGDSWLQHRPKNPVPLGTVLQPVIKCRKSVTKLTSMKDVVNPKQSKYVLISQNQDEEGDLETKLYKGDIIPTCSGGAQVIFDDVEKLKQESPTHQSGSAKKYKVNEREFGSSVDKCSISIEGHGKKLRM